ncbi:MAG: undecaprenyl/decaprenyl-phosphate alpha-N-acetylglucosaminyl 1-phosphate transferase [Candidatus Margulisbacteria bacterium]|nr:undecaprenyl/decaprenyl-phosphate alpha-N-acetylglucosaminyl 1-phosphate transferase [Candidatus Margulisiibacteriota bacterium]MBU1616403.1 undecaprenyl/decaprenyl-phosphate alpha-N-acetylglucosaminyl 1-phosphate transferase [Candidatus Margulisiibacteriota bacterium]MBU1867121.1 undecaprenyl/decaprenyl-phosphate alpha-N-acetylglucosaminyl 1-phosphate transferase [Candidatus Margulisiibacteriota bacterium]
MVTNLMVFVISLIGALVFTPLAKWLSNKTGILDKPGFRKIHNQPIPRMGGEAILLAIGLGLIFYFPNQRELWSVLGFAFLFVIFGLVDDADIKIRARNKILSHLLFSFLFIYFSGITLTFFSVNWLNWLVTACFITFMTNSMNMLDGMDGLVTGISCISAGFFAILAVNSGQLDLLLLSLAIMGGSLGFLRYNFNPASIFLGEAGSTLLGFLMAMLAVKLNIFTLWNIALTLGIERLQIISFVVPLIILGIPIFDTYFVFSNRFLHRIKFSQPGKDHSHHRIHLMGFSQKATVLTLYAVQIVLGSIGLAMIRADIQQFFSLLLIVAVFFVSFTMLLLRVKVYEHNERPA